MGPEIRGFVPSPEDPYVSVRIYYCRALLCLGQVDQALLRINEALVEARRISPFNIAYALNLTSIGYREIYGKEFGRGQNPSSSGRTIGNLE